MAKKTSRKTTRNKTAVRRKTAGAARTGSSSKKKKTGTTRKKTTRRSIPVAGSVKANSRKKTSAGKKKTTTSRKKKTTTRKKTTSRKTKATGRKTARAAAGRKTTGRKTTGKKTSVRKTASKTAGRKASNVKAVASGADAPPTKRKPRKKTTPGESAAKKRGRSVAEVASASGADEQGYVFINGRRVRMISTAGKVVPKRPRETPEEAAAAESAAEEIRPRKSYLSKRELRHYRDMLLIKRAELVGDLSAMEAEALRSSGGNISNMPIHMADIGTDTYDQDFMLGLAEAERRQIREIDDALRRIDEGTYGICQMTGEDIPKARLDAKPWAKYTIEAARLIEAGHQPR